MAADAKPGRRASTWLTRNLIVLTVISLLQDAASELVYPLLPLLLTGVFAAPPIVLGFIEGTAEATAGITRYFAGRWSDTRGRKPFVGAGYSLAAAGKVLVAASTGWGMVLAGRVVDRFGKGIRSAPRDALIADSVPHDALGRAFGFHRAGDSLGAVIGPLLGLAALAALGGNVRATLWVAVIPACLSALLVFAVREPRAAVEKRREALAKRHTEVGHSPLPRQFWVVVIPLATIALVNFPDAMLLLRFMDLGYSSTQVVLAYVLFNTVYTLAAYPAGVLTDKWPRPFVYAVGLTAFAVGYLGLGLVGQGPWVFVLIAVYGLFPAFTDGVGKAWISSLVPSDLRGRAQGVYQALTSGAVFLAGLWAGALWLAGGGNGTLPLIVSGCVASVAALAMVGVRLTVRR